MKAETIQKYQKKSIPDLRARAKYYFNLFIRLRDTDENGYGRCISSGQPLKWGANSQAGHYKSGGKFSSLEFNENNVHLQGKSDNYFNGGNLLEYRKNLIMKIGIDMVEELELIAAQSKRTVFHYDRFRLIEVIEIYREKCKKLASEKNFHVRI